MLAHKFDPAKIVWDDYVYMQPKLDGVRCLFTKDGAFSRTGKQFMNIKHIEKDLGHVFDALPWLVLDGELYNHNLRDNFEKIISLVRKQKPTEEDKYEARVWTQYHVYDYTGIDYSSKMIESCMKRFKEETNFKFEIADVRDLSIFEDQSFDIVLLATDHDNFDYNLINNEARLIIDTRGIFKISRKVFAA